MPKSVTRHGALRKTFQLTLLMAALFGLTACDTTDIASPFDTASTATVEEGAATPSNSASSPDAGTGTPTSSDQAGVDGDTGNTSSGDGSTSEGSTGGDDIAIGDTGTGGDTSAGGDAVPGDDGNTGGSDPVTARTVTLNWQAPMNNVDGTVLTDLAGYRVYWGVAPGVYTDSVQITDARTTQVTLNAPGPGTYYFAATAFDGDANEGPYSNVTSVVIN